MSALDVAALVIGSSIVLMPVVRVDVVGAGDEERVLNAFLLFFSILRIRLLFQILGLCIFYSGFRYNALLWVFFRISELVPFCCRIQIENNHMTLLIVLIIFIHLNGVIN